MEHARSRRCVLPRCHTPVSRRVGYRRNRYGGIKMRVWVNTVTLKCQRKQEVSFEEVKAFAEALRKYVTAPLLQQAALWTF